MKKILLLLTCSLYYALCNLVYAQYFDVKQETPRDYCVVAITNGIKLEGKYYFFRVDWPEGSKRAYNSHKMREYHYPVFSAINASNGDSLFSTSVVPLDTNHVRQILYMDTLGTDFIGFGADVHNYGPFGSTTDYDFRAL